MIKNSKEVKECFSRLKVDVLYFVKGMPFYKEGDANSQARTIGKGGKPTPPVICVTRAEAEAPDEEGGDDTLVEDLVNGGQPDQLPTKAEGGKVDELPTMIVTVVTEDDLVNNPDLVGLGVKVGDKIEVPMPYFNEKREKELEDTLSEMAAKNEAALAAGPAAPLEGVKIYKDHNVTEEDLINNPSWLEQGIKVGDVVPLPVSPEMQATIEAALAELNAAKAEEATIKQFTPVVKKKEIRDRVAAAQTRVDELTK